MALNIRDIKAGQYLTPDQLMELSKTAPEGWKSTWLKDVYEPAAWDGAKPTRTLGDIAWYNPTDPNERMAYGLLYSPLWDQPTGLTKDVEGGEQVYYLNGRKVTPVAGDGYNGIKGYKYADNQFQVGSEWDGQSVPEQLAFEYKNPSKYIVDKPVTFDWREEYAKGKKGGFGEFARNFALAFGGLSALAGAGLLGAAGSGAAEAGAAGGFVDTLGGMTDAMGNVLPSWTDAASVAGSAENLAADLMTQNPNLGMMDATELANQMSTTGNLPYQQTVPLSGDLGSGLNGLTGTAGNYLPDMSQILQLDPAVSGALQNTGINLNNLGTPITDATPSMWEQVKSMFEPSASSSMTDILKTANSVAGMFGDDPNNQAQKNANAVPAGTFGMKINPYQVGLLGQMPVQYQNIFGG